MKEIVWVGIGGFLGANARYLVGSLFARYVSASLPWGTLAVNSLGSFLMGLLFVLFLERLAAGPEVRSAVLVAVQDQHLRNRHPGGFIRALPPLQTMEVLLFEMIGLGFFLLSLALVSGLMFLENMFDQNLAHKTILSGIAWLVFGTLLWGRFRFGWRGRTAITWTLSGFVVLMLAYFGSKAVLELILQR